METGTPSSRRPRLGWVILPCAVAAGIYALVWQRGLLEGLTGGGHAWIAGGAVALGLLLQGYFAHRHPRAGFAVPSILAAGGLYWLCWGVGHPPPFTPAGLVPLIGVALGCGLIGRLAMPRRAEKRPVETPGSAETLESGLQTGMIDKEVGKEYRAVLKESRERKAAKEPPP